MHAHAHTHAHIGTRTTGMRQHSLTMGHLSLRCEVFLASLFFSRSDLKRENFRGTVIVS